MLKNRPVLKAWLLGHVALIGTALLLEAFSGAGSARNWIYTFVIVVGVPVTVIWLAVAALSSAARAADRAGEKVFGSSWRKASDGANALIGALADGMAAAGKNRPPSSSTENAIDDGGPQNYYLRKADQQRMVQTAVETAIKNSNKRA